MSKYILTDPDDTTRKWDIEIEDNKITKMVESPQYDCEKLAIILDKDIMPWQYTDALNHACATCDRKGSTKECPKEDRQL